MNKLETNKKNCSDKTFEDIKNIDEYGNEYWYARELQKVLEYKEWRNFEKVIKKAIISAKNSNEIKLDWVVEVNKSIKTGKGKEEIIRDYKLSRYICYLIVQNADPIKEVVALGQTYFAIQTRKQEITEQEYDMLSETEKRLYQRKLIKEEIILYNKLLQNKNSVISKMEITASDNKNYNTDIFNLDAIIAVGYRISSKKATEFRIWATKILKVL